MAVDAGKLSGPSYSACTSQLGKDILVAQQNSESVGAGIRTQTGLLPGDFRFVAHAGGMRIL
jgi:hypothetical protein